MNAIVTVIGQDKVGIIAAVCALLAENNVNILDISQTIVSGLFSMIMVVDMASEHTNFDVVNQQLHTLGEELGLQIRIQRNEIFDAMHHV